MKRTDPSHGRRIYQPTAADLIPLLPDMGESLRIGCIELARAQSVDMVDALTPKVKTLDQMLIRLRTALIHDEEAQHDPD